MAGGVVSQSLIDGISEAIARAVRGELQELWWAGAAAGAGWASAFWLLVLWKKRRD
jgi:hypothetical protein